MLYRRCFSAYFYLLRRIKLIKGLNIYGEDGIYYFDEMLNDLGEWVKCEFNYNTSNIRELNIENDNYIYFVHQDENCRHTLLRNIKKL